MGLFCRFGWRRCTEFEKEALLVHYKKMGVRMGIKGLEAWKTWDDANAFQTAYGVRCLWAVLLMVGCFFFCSGGVFSNCHHHVSLRRGK